MWLGNEDFSQLSNTTPSFLRLVCKSLQHHPQPFIQASAMLSHVYPQLKACAHYGGVFLLLFWELDQPMLYISEHMRWSKSLPEGMTRPIGINGLRLVSVFFTWERERGEKSLLTDICFFLVGSFCGCGGYDCEWCTHESIRWYVPSPPYSSFTLHLTNPIPHKSSNNECKSTNPNSAPHSLAHVKSTQQKGSRHSTFPTQQPSPWPSLSPPSNSQSTNN